LIHKLNNLRRSEDRAIQAMANTPDGKTFMEWLDKMDGRILKKDKQGTVDSYAMAYQAGVHDIIHKIKDIINER